MNSNASPLSERALRVWTTASLAVMAGAAIPPAFGATDTPPVNTTQITIENHSDRDAKVAAPGAPPVQAAAGVTDAVLELTPTTANGVDVKAWWIANPRELCVIFVRYGGVLKISGSRSIRCLGN